MIIKSISDTLFRTYNFKVSISLFLNEPDSADNQQKKYQRAKLITKVEDKVNPVVSSIYLDTYNRSIIGLLSTYTTEDYQKLTDGIYLSQKNFYELDSALSLCMTWLKSNQFKFLFNVDPNTGEVKGLGGPAPYNPVVYKNQTEFVRFFPAVVKDQNGISYEGISIRTQRGPITQLTCTEFLTMASIVRNYISNLYGNTLQLLMTGMLLSNSKI